MMRMAVREAAFFFSLLNSGQLTFHWKTWIQQVFRFTRSFSPGLHESETFYLLPGWSINPLKLAKVGGVMEKHRLFVFDRTLHTLLNILLVMGTHCLFFVVVVLLRLSQFSPIALPCPARLTHSHGLSPPCCPCPWVIYPCSLSRPFPFFPPSSPLPVHVILFLVSMPLVLFCSLFFNVENNRMWNPRTYWTLSDLPLFTFPKFLLQFLSLNISMKA